MTTSQKTRDELGKLYRDERDDLRCTLKADLYQQAKELTGDIDVEITTIKEELDGKQLERDRILKDGKLLGLVDNPRGSCSLTDTHPSLLQFDEITIIGRRKILNQK